MGINFSCDSINHQSLWKFHVLSILSLWECVWRSSWRHFLLQIKYSKYASPSSFMCHVLYSLWAISFLSGVEFLWECDNVAQCVMWWLLICFTKIFNMIWFKVYWCKLWRVFHLFLHNIIGMIKLLTNLTNAIFVITWKHLKTFLVITCRVWGQILNRIKASCIILPFFNHAMV